MLCKLCLSCLVGTGGMVELIPTGWDRCTWIPLHVYFQMRRLTGLLHKPSYSFLLCIYVTLFVQLSYFYIRQDWCVGEQSPSSPLLEAWTDVCKSLHFLIKKPVAKQATTYPKRHCGWKQIEGMINPWTDFAGWSMLLYLDTKQLLAWADQQGGGQLWVSRGRQRFWRIQMGCSH